MPKGGTMSARGLGRRCWSGARGSLAGGLVILWVVLLWIRFDFGFVTVIRFVLGWVLLLLAPGVALLRALHPIARSRSGELALGAATGVCLQIAVWLPLAVMGLGNVAIASGPAALVLVFAVPSLRRRALSAPTEPTSVLERWLVAAVAGIAVTAVAADLRNTPIPPNGGQQSIDTFWHLALIHATSHGSLPEVPQFFGHPLHYHYFSHVHLALMSEATGVRPELLLERLWVFPMILIAVYGLASLVRLLTSDRLAPGLAAAIAFGGMTLKLTTFSSVPVAGIVLLSPSQVLASALMAPIACGFVAVCRAKPDWRLSIWLLILVVGSMGSKSTVMPVVISGTLAALGYAAWRQRDLVRRLVPWVVVQALLLLVAIPLIAGTGGGRLSILSSLTSMTPYRQLIDPPAMRAIERGFFVDSLNSLPAVGAALLTLAFFVVNQLLRLLGLLAVQLRGANAAASWWLGAAGLSGYAVMFVVDHPGFSQLYFPVTSMIYLSALSAVCFARLRATRGARRPLGIALLVGFVLSFYWPAIASGMAPRQNWTFVWQVLVAVVGVGILPLVIGGAGRRGTSMRRGPAYVVALYGLLLGLTIPTALQGSAHDVGTVLRPGPIPTKPASALYVSTGELQSMVWLREHSSPGDRQVTNLHCVPPPTAANCDARGFWVVGMSGVPAALEGWGYTEEVFERHGQGGLNAVNQPPPHSPAADRSRAFFATPSDQAARELSDLDSVDWVVVVNRAGAVPELRQLTSLELAFDNGEVTIYRIKG